MDGPLTAKLSGTSGDKLMPLPVPNNNSDDEPIDAEFTEVTSTRRAWEWAKSKAHAAFDWLKTKFRTVFSGASGAPAAENHAKLNTGWILLGILATTGVGLAFVWIPLGLLVAAIIALFLATCLHEVKDPDDAVLFRTGRQIGRLQAGWYLTIPYFYDILVIERGWIRVEFSDEDVYTDDTPPRKFFASGATFFRPKDGSGSITQILLMPEKEMAEKVKHVALAEMRRQFGKRTTHKLLTEKANIEIEARERLKKELDANGYEQGDYEISRMKAASVEIRDLGRARGDANKHMADPLKGNYAGALVIVGQTLAEPLAARLAGEAQKASSKLHRTTQQSSEPGQTQFELTPEVARALSELLDRQRS